MAEPVIFSSQGSQYEQHQILNEEQENLGFSPFNPRSGAVSHFNSRKPRKPPTVTPKRFRKFFTPRTTLSSRGGRQSKAGRQLRDITKNGANWRRNARSLQKFDLEPVADDKLARPLKRRRLSNDLASSPPQSSPLKHVQTAEQIKLFEDVPTSPIMTDEDALSDMFDELQPFPQPIRRLRQSGRNQRILQRSFGGYDTLKRGRRGNEHCMDWRAETANFVTSPFDMHPFTGIALPFCTASCNTNSLIAIGEEEGSVRLIDSSPLSHFSQSHVALHPHRNAVMDITFSSDDYMLATASGDQTARIIDMHSQRTICILSGHTSSVKQVRFQPNDDNMITTSSRDGSVQIWDLRCGGKGSVALLRTAFARNVDNGGVEPTVRYSKYTLDVGSVHRSTKNWILQSTSSPHSEAAGVSITSVHHLPNGREHLLLTASEHNASIKLWDLRSAGRRGLATPLSSTPVPKSHIRTRNYGVNAMALSGDGARLYTVCRDSTVYVYSTNHLALGCASVISSSASNGRMAKTPKASVGPLYGFRHPQLRTGTFYVKASMRMARDNHTEILAVGSSDNCAMLFPTDERHLPRRELRAEAEDDDDEAELPTLPAAIKPKSATQENGIQIHEHGTPLVRAHNKEVTSLAWTHDGELVTVCDDFTARCWREDAITWRELKLCGEVGGRRWGCGWAEVGDSWEEEG